MQSIILFALVTTCCAHTVGKLRATNPIHPDAPAVAAVSQDDGEKGQQYPRKVTMQISEKEVEEFLGKLSADCKVQYTEIISGRGAGLHTFGSPGVESTAESCTQLNGSLCSTMAHVQQKTTNSSGRSMRTTVDVRGHGCLPKACIAKADLAILAAFMHSNAKSSGTIAGEGVELNLHVDCSASGGSIVDSPEQENEHHDEHVEKNSDHGDHAKNHAGEQAETDKDGTAPDHVDHEHKQDAKSFAVGSTMSVSLVSTVYALLMA